MKALFPFCLSVLTLVCTSLIITAVTDGEIVDGVFGSMKLFVGAFIALAVFQIFVGNQKTFMILEWVKSREKRWNFVRALQVLYFTVLVVWGFAIIDLVFSVTSYFVYDSVGQVLMYRLPIGDLRITDKELMLIWVFGVIAAIRIMFLIFSFDQDYELEKRELELVDEFG